MPSAIIKHGTLSLHRARVRPILDFTEHHYSEFKYIRIDICSLSNHAIIIFIFSSLVYEAGQTVFLLIKRSKKDMWLLYHYLKPTFTIITIYVNENSVQKIYILFLFSEKLISETYVSFAELIPINRKVLYNCISIHLIYLSASTISHESSFIELSRRLISKSGRNWYIGWFWCPDSERMTDSLTTVAMNHGRTATTIWCLLVRKHH